MSETYSFTLSAPAVMAHPNLDKPRGFKGDSPDKAKYSAHLVLAADHPDLPALKTLMMKCARAKWATRDLKTDFEFPLKDGTRLADRRKQKAGKDDGDYQRGKFVLTTRSKYQPAMSIVLDRRIVELDKPELIEQHKNKFLFFGAEVLAQVSFATYEGVGNNPDGVTAYLNMILATGKGSRIAGGAPSATEAFKGYVGALSGDDPTAGLTEDDIAF